MIILDLRAAVTSPLPLILDVPLYCGHRVQHYYPHPPIIGNYAIGITVYDLRGAASGGEGGRAPSLRSACLVSVLWTCTQRIQLPLVASHRNDVTAVLAFPLRRAENKKLFFHLP